MRTFLKLISLFSCVLFFAACTTNPHKTNPGKNRHVKHNSYSKAGGRTGFEKIRAQSVAGVNKRTPKMVSRQRAGANGRNIITIRGDSGGLLTSYVYRVNASANRGDLVRIGGNCDSACTLYLALPRNQICIMPGTTFRFHRPYSASSETSRRATIFMMNAYPRWVRNWIRRNGGLQVSLKSMDFAYAARHVRVCDTKTRENLKTTIARIPGMRPGPI